MNKRIDSIVSQGFSDLQCVCPQDGRIRFFTKKMEVRVRQGILVWIIQEEIFFVDSNDGIRPDRLKSN